MDGSTIKNASAVSTIYQQQAVTQPLAKSASGSTEQKKATIESPSNDTVQVSSRVTLRNLDTSRAIEQLHASLNQQAKSVRETNESINQVVDQIDSMKSSLQEITKNYPPFPVDSKERNAILMEYTSLRKELVRLMVPAPPPPVYEKVNHMWSSLFDQNGQILSTAIPEVDKKTSDAELQSAYDKLTSTTYGLADFSNKVTQALVSP